MAKKRVTSRQIQGEIARRLDAAQRMPELYRTLRSWTPKRAKPAPGGANWHIERAHVHAMMDGDASQPLDDEIDRVVAEVQKEFDCNEW